MTTALLLDIGNSRLKWGVLEDGAIRRTGHIARDSIKDHGLAALTQRLPRHVDTVLASNVAGSSFATRLSGVVGMHCGCDLQYVHVAKQAHGITSSYRQPRRLGVDRWVAMIGAWAEAQAACVIVDAGTAVTIDVLDDEGQHLGGQIIPGIALMATALSLQTSDIADVQPRRTAQSRGMSMFASSTSRAVEQGAINAVVGAIERALRTLDASGYAPEIFLTGGDASRILRSLEQDVVHRPHLVLQGLARILESRQ
jgi:type III pantothenate kinase